VARRTWIEVADRPRTGGRAIDGGTAPREGILRAAAHGRSRQIVVVLVLRPGLRPSGSTPGRGPTNRRIPRG